MVMRFTDEVKAKCAEREARIRREVYPNRVYTKRMSQQLAAAEYRAKCRTLFDGPDLVHAAGSADRKAEEV